MRCRLGSSLQGFDWIFFSKLGLKDDHMERALNDLRHGAFSRANLVECCIDFAVRESYLMPRPILLRDWDWVPVP